MEFSIDRFTTPTDFQLIHTEIDHLIGQYNGCLAKAYLNNSTVAEDGIVIRGEYETIAGIMDRYADNQMIILPIDTSEHPIFEYQTVVIFHSKAS